MNLASTNTQCQETQGQGTSNIHEHIQNQQHCFQSINFYQDANNISRSNQSNDRDLSRKAVNNLIPELNNNLCNFNLNAQDQRYQISSTELTNNQIDNFHNFTIVHKFTSDLQSSVVLKVAKDKLAPTMIIRWNEYVLRQSVAQPNLINFKDSIDNYAEACEELATLQRQTKQENCLSRRSNRRFQQQSNERCPLCGYSHNLGKCNQFLKKDNNERQ